MKPLSSIGRALRGDLHWSCLLLLILLTYITIRQLCQRTFIRMGGANSRQEWVTYGIDSANAEGHILKRRGRRTSRRNAHPEALGSIMAGLGEKGGGAWDIRLVRCNRNASINPRSSSL